MSSFCKRYCSVPGCSTYKTKDISLHLFPKDDKIKKSWQRILRIGKPISTYMNVCSQHFEESDFKKLKSPTAKRLLKNGALPSRNLPLASHSTKKHPIDRSKRKWLAIDDYASLEMSSSCEVESVPSTSTQMHQEIANDFEMAQEPTESSIHEWRIDTADKSTQAGVTEFPFQGYLDDDKKLFSFTGITFKMFNAIETCVLNVMIENKSDIANLRMKILLVLIKLKVNMSFVCLSVLFNLSAATCSRFFYNTLTNLALALKPLIFWPPKEEILANLPKCFEKYKNNRVVLDCTEVPLQKCKCLKCRIKTYSHYKGTHTVKFLIGITPSGLISFCSSGYGGRASDKAIVLKENVLDKCDPHDAIMVDKGFMIEKECQEMFLKLIRPPFLKKQSQFSKKDATDTADIARARVHVERAIQRIKLIDIIRSQLPWYLVPCIDEIMTVVCALVNLSSPILADDKFDDEMSPEN